MRIAPGTLCLYAVTDRTWSVDRETFFKKIESAIDGGAKIIQLREKHLSEEEYLEEAVRFVEICHLRGAVAVIDDSVDVCLRSGADGVHLGQGDMDVTQARKLLGQNRVLGVSAHSPEEARIAEAQGADYLGAGAVFETGTKSDASPLTRETLKAITASVSIPVVAIGGISADNLPQLAGLGLAGVAAASAIFAGDNVKVSAMKLRRLAEKIAG